MKTRIKITVASMLMVLMIISLIACNKYLAVAENRNDITGTWTLDSYKYGTTDVFTPSNARLTRMKVITEDAFHWVSYDTITGRLQSSAGGSYVLESDSYTETIIYGLGMDKYLGTKSVFKLKSEDDMLFITGELSDGLHIEEVWRKIK